MIRPIYLYGREVLRETAQDVNIADKEAIAALVADLKDTLVVADGCGLAAPQIGVSSRVVIVDGTQLVDTYPELENFKRTLINPVVLEESSANCVFSEGCLSVPGVYADVTRPSSIKVKYYNEALEPVEEVFDGFACRMVQHELDHLDGTLFVDKVAPIRKKIIAKKLLTIAKGHVSTAYKTK